MYDVVLLSSVFCILIRGTATLYILILYYRFINLMHCQFNQQHVVVLSILLKYCVLFCNTVNYLLMLYTNGKSVNYSFLFILRSRMQRYHLTFIVVFYVLV